KSIKVGKGAFIVTLSPRRTFFELGDELAIDVFTTSLSGSPVSTEVSVVLEREVWNALYGRYEISNIPAGSMQVRTDREGKGMVVFPTQRSGRRGEGGCYRVSGRAQDDRGNSIT